MPKILSKKEAVEYLGLDEKIFDKLRVNKESYDSDIIVLCREEKQQKKTSVISKTPARAAIRRYKDIGSNHILSARRIGE